MFFSGRPPVWQPQRQAVRQSLWSAVLSGAALVLSVAAAQATSVSGSVSVTQLPPQAQSTARLIRSAGPFPYPKDGTVFGNYERALPYQTRGYYREYTVRTPGSHDRGARRIVCGGQKPSRPDACYYTDNHYASFRKIVQ